MEKYTFKVNYFEKMKTLNDLESLLYEFRNKFGSFHSPKDTEKEVLDKLTELLEEKCGEIEKLQNELIDFFKDKLHRFWNMKIISFSENGHKYEEEYDIYPYGFINENYYLECLQIQNDYYNTSFSDRGFVLDELVKKNCIIELQEMDSEDFLTKFSKYANEIFIRRMNKIKEKENK
jgi:hypothetical protein